MSVEYWNNYYSIKNSPFENSLFSKFVLDKLEHSKSLIDIGCGNGRDSLFFSKNKIKTLGIDFSKSAIKNLKQYSNKNLEFNKIDIASINTQLIDRYFDYGYCRFLLHSLDEDTEMQLFLWLSKYIKDSIFIETRIDKDLENEKFQNHYRRSINSEKLYKLIENFNFEIIYSKISNKFSPYNQNYEVKDIRNNPFLLRIVAIRKK